MGRPINGPGLAVVGKKLKALENRQAQLRPIIAKLTGERDNAVREEAMVCGAIQICKEMLVELQQVNEIDPPDDPN